MQDRELVSVTADAARFSERGEPCWDPAFAAHRAALAAYRPIRRFIRRHMLVGADGRVKRLLRMHEVDRGEAIWESQRDSDAWAYGMWRMRLEDESALESRRLASDYELPRSTMLGRHALDFEMRICADERTLNDSRCDWLFSHAAAASLRLVWARARALAQGMAKARDGAFGRGMLEGRNKLELLGELADDGSITFTSFGPSSNHALHPRPHQEKSQRREAYQRAMARRHERVLDTCRGPCLRFTFEKGWQTVYSAAPDPSHSSAGVRRLRLFVKGRPAFYLFPFERGYCARLCDKPMEVWDSAPWRAIDTLRHAVVRHERMFGKAVGVA